MKIKTCGDLARHAGEQGAKTLPMEEAMSLFRIEGEGAGERLVIARETEIERERHLEIWLENSPMALTEEPILWIGKRPSTTDEDGTLCPDLLGVDSEGNPIIVELKRGRPPREVVGQLLDYAAAFEKLSYDEILKIAADYFQDRDELREKNFEAAFRDEFDTAEVPQLTRKLRLFIVAEEIPKRLTSVCQFLRTSYKMDISCVAVSTFQTETGDRLAITDTTVGGETIVTPEPQRKNDLESPRWPGPTGVRQVVLEAVKELTGGNTDCEFTLKELVAHVQRKYPGFKKGTVQGQVYKGCPNIPSNKYHSGDFRYYWRIDLGKYRLHEEVTAEVPSGDA